MAEVIAAVGAARSEPGTRLVLPEGFAGEALVRALAPRSTEVATADDVGAVLVEAAVEDAAVQRATLERELARAVAERDRARGMLANERFTVAKRPPRRSTRSGPSKRATPPRPPTIESRLAGLDRR